MTKSKVYASVQVSDRTIELRDIQEEDVAPIVRYWHDSDHRYLESLGVDINKLRTREETAALFKKSLRATRAPFDRATLVFSDNEKAIGYTNLNYRDEGVAYAHVHILYPEYLGLGFMSELFQPAVRVFFTEFPTRELRFETSTTNARINRYLEKVGMVVSKTEYVENPDGMARAGLFNLYVVTKESVVNSR